MIYLIKYFTLTLVVILLFFVKQVKAGSPPIPAPPSRETLDRLEAAGKENEEKYGAWPSGMPTNVKSTGETGLPIEVNILNARISATPVPTLIPSQLELIITELKNDGLPREFSQGGLESTDFRELDYGEPLSNLTLDTDNIKLDYSHAVNISDSQLLELFKSANEHIFLDNKNIIVSSQWAEKFPEEHRFTIKNQNRRTHIIQFKFSETMNAFLDETEVDPDKVVIVTDGFGTLEYTITKKTFIGLVKQSFVDFIIGDKTFNNVGSVQKMIINFLRK